VYTKIKKMKKGCIFLFLANLFAVFSGDLRLVGDSSLIRFESNDGSQKEELTREILASLKAKAAEPTCDCVSEAKVAQMISEKAVSEERVLELVDEFSSASFRELVASVDGPDFSYINDADMMSAIFDDECESGAKTLHFNDVGNNANRNWLIFDMKRAVAARSYTTRVRSHPGNNYHGTSKLYGSNDRSTWTELASLSGEGSCSWKGPAPISDRTKFEYFKLTMCCNGRGTYQAVSHIDIEI
jgi:hypothetical protein